MKISTKRKAIIKKENEYTKGYNEGALDQVELFKINKYKAGLDIAHEDMADASIYAWQTAQEVKSWNRSPISETVNITYLFLAFIIGFSVCAIVVTPIIIQSI